MNIGKVNINGKTYNVSIKEDPADGDTPAASAATTETSDKDNFNNIPCVRCIIRNHEQFGSLHKCIDNANRTLRKENPKVSILKLGQSELTNSHIVAVDVGACPNNVDDIIDVKFCRVFLQEMLSSTSIEYDFITYDKCLKNTIEDSGIFSHDYNLICIERSEIGDAAFDAICKKVYGDIDVSDIISVRLQNIGFNTTVRCNWGYESGCANSIENNDAVAEKSNKPNKNSVKTQFVSLLIDNKDAYNAFNKFVKESKEMIDIEYDRDMSTYRSIGVRIPYTNDKTIFNMLNTLSGFGIVAMAI